MSTGRGSGENAALQAAMEALKSPLLDVSIKSATRVLFRITGGEKLTLSQVSSAAGTIQKAVDPAANIIFGVNVDPNLRDEVRLTLIATGLAAPDKPAFAGIDMKSSQLYRL